MSNGKIWLALPFVASAVGLATLGVLAAGQGAAQAAVQTPVHVPVNQCGNTVSVIGALNPAFGNHC